MAESRWVDLRRYGGTVLLWAGALYSVLPLWIVPYPPLQDVPQHLAAIRVLHSYADPAFGLSEHFVLQLGHTQYLAYYLACDALTFLVDLHTANLLLASLSIAALPLTAGALLASLGRDRSLGLSVVPLTYNAHLILGFLNFISALPLCLYGLALSVRQQQRYSRVRALGLAALMLICFYTHVVPCALLMLGHGLISLSRSRSRLLAGLWPVVPSLPAILMWVLRSPAGSATVQATGMVEGHARATFRPVERALHELPSWLLDVFNGRRDQDVMNTWVGLMGILAAVALVQALRGAGVDKQTDALRRRLLLLPVLCLLAYLVLPSGYDWIWPIAERFALLACILSVPVLPVLLGKGRWLVLSALLSLSVVHVQNAQAAFRGFADEVGDFDAALAAIPPRKAVAGLIFDRGSRHVRFAPFLHYAAFYQAKKGGVVMFTFADFPQSPFAFRTRGRPPRVPPRWEWMPQRVVPDRDLTYYEYLLVRGSYSPLLQRSRRFERVELAAGRWSVWRRQ